MTDPEREPVAGIDALDSELANYSEELAGRPQMIVVTKADAIQERSHIEKVQRLAADRSLACHTISSVSGDGIVELVRAVGEQLDALPPIEERSDG